MSLDPDTLNNTLKLELDYGAAVDEDDARRIVSHYVLQVLVGRDVANSRTRQATLLTVVNAGSRAFLGGVRVHLVEDFVLQTPWGLGEKASQVLAEFANVSFVDVVDPDRPAVVIGQAIFEGANPLYPTWEGWSAGVVASPAERLAEASEFALSGVLSGGLAVSEAFQWTRGYKVAAARSVGLSLWMPGMDWRSPDATGVSVARLPDNVWLLGLGHLGQAYAWAFGFLPFPHDRRGDVNIMLQDVDEIVDSNEATSMLVWGGRRGLKTRLVSQQLEAIGFRVRMTERLFDESTHRNDNLAASSSPAEPRLALAGFDGNQPRRLLEGAGFSYVVDAGLGVGRFEYLGISLNSFPSGQTAYATFPERATADVPEVLDRPVYEAAAQRAVDRGEAQDMQAAKCGLIEVAGKAAGAAFVGTVAAAVAVSELLRIANEGQLCEYVSINLRSPQSQRAYLNSKRPLNPGYIDADAD